MKCEQGLTQNTNSNFYLKNLNILKFKKNTHTVGLLLSGHFPYTVGKFGDTTDLQPLQLMFSWAASSNLWPNDSWTLHWPLTVGEVSKSVHM